MGPSGSGLTGQAHATQPPLAAQYVAPAAPVPQVYHHYPQPASSHAHHYEIEGHMPPPAPQQVVYPPYNPPPPAPQPAAHNRAAPQQLTSHVHQAVYAPKDASAHNPAHVNMAHQVSLPPQQQATPTRGPVPVPITVKAPHVGSPPVVVAAPHSGVQSSHPWYQHSQSVAQTKQSQSWSVTQTVADPDLPDYVYV